MRTGFSAPTDLPLAQAAAYLADTATGVADYLTLLAERTTELLAHGASAMYPVSLAASVQIALDRLAAQSPAVLQLLTLAAYLGPEPIPLTLFSTHPTQLPNPLATAAADPLATAAPDPLVFAALARLLRQHGLARVEPAILQLHRLLAAILRTQPHQQQDLPTRAVRPGSPRSSTWNSEPADPASPWAAGRADKAVAPSRPAIMPDRHRPVMPQVTAVDDLFGTHSPR